MSHTQTKSFSENVTYNNTPEGSTATDNQTQIFYNKDNSIPKGHSKHVSVRRAYQIDENLPIFEKDDEKDDESILREQIRLAFENGRKESDHLVEKIHMQGSSSFEHLETLLTEENLEQLLNETSISEKFLSSTDSQKGSTQSTNSSRTVRFDLTSSTQELTRKVHSNNFWSPKMKPRQPFMTD